MAAQPHFFRKAPITNVLHRKTQESLSCLQCSEQSRHTEGMSVSVCNRTFPSSWESQPTISFNFQTALLKGKTKNVCMCLIALFCVCLGLQLLHVLTNSALIQSHEVGMRIILISVLRNGGSSGAKVTCSRMHSWELLWRSRTGI